MAERVADLEQGDPVQVLVGVQGGGLQQSGQQGIFHHGKVFPQRILQGQRRRRRVEKRVFFRTLENIVDHFIETDIYQLVFQALDDLPLAVDAHKRIGRQRHL